MNKKSWFRHYDQSVPYTVAPDPEYTLMGIVSDSAAQRANHPALLFQGMNLLYGELERLTTSLASSLTELSVKPGDRVAFLPQCSADESGTGKGVQ